MCRKQRFPHHPDGKKHWSASHHVNEVTASSLSMLFFLTFDLFHTKDMQSQQAEGEVTYIHVPTLKFRQVLRTGFFKKGEAGVPEKL